MLVGALALVLVLIVLLIYLIVSRTGRESAARAKATARRKHSRPIASSRATPGVYEVVGAKQIKPLRRHRHPRLRWRALVYSRSTISN
jgi:hypothetical protein